MFTVLQEWAIPTIKIEYISGEINLASLFVAEEITKKEGMA
jgi:hypothetical protein